MDNNKTKTKTKNKQTGTKTKHPKNYLLLSSIIISSINKKVYFPYCNKAPYISDRSPAINKACRLKLGINSEPLFYHHNE